MGTVGKLYRKIESLDLEAIAAKSIEKTKEYIADFNAEQLNKGQRSDGSFLPDYSPRSVEEFGKPEGPIKLYDTGAFYQGIYVKLENGHVITTSSDEKTDMLFKRYATKTKNIFGLNPQFKGEYLREFLRPEFRKEIKEATGL